MKQEIRFFSQSICLAIAVLSLSLHGSAFADVAFNGSTPATTSLPLPQDFAARELLNAWDMNESTDTRGYLKLADSSGLSSFVFSNGLLSTSVTQGGAYFYLLPPGVCSSNPTGISGAITPINTQTYTHLNVRMYTDIPSTMTILVNTSCNYAENYWHSVNLDTFAGWHTYRIDLRTLGVNTSAGPNTQWQSVPATGLRIDPSGALGAQLLFDWISLSGNASPSTVDSNYTFTPDRAGERFSVFLDDNADVNDGLVRTLSFAGNAGSTFNVGAEGLFGGDYNMVALSSRDFASLFNNPWDFSDRGDVIVGIGLNGSFNSGKYTTTTLNPSSYFYLNFGANSFNPSVFRYMRIQLNSSAAGSAAVNFIDSTGQISYGLTSFLVSQGANTIDIDLQGVAGLGSNPVARMWINPLNQTGQTVEFDYVSLRTDGYGLPDPDLTPVDSNWSFRVNNPPRLNILQPDAAGGEDFASSVLGNPWNMDGVDDMHSSFNSSSPQFLPNNYVSGFQGNFFKSTSLINDYDPYQHSLKTFDPLEMIDATRFKNVVYRLFVDASQDYVLGSIVRIVWRADGPGDLYYNGDDTITFDGWNNYAQHMPSIILEPDAHAPGSYPNPAWNNAVNVLRVDAHEFSTPTDYYFDYIRVTAHDESNSQYAITFEVSDLDADPVQIDFYYNSTNSTSGGTYIGTKLMSEASRSLIWDTSAIAAGTYYVYGRANDGINEVYAKASGPIVISHSRAQDSAAPVLVLDSPTTNQNIFNDFVVRGYALDNIQTASVEVHLDGQLLKRFNHQLFDSRAQEQYRSFAESGNAGFFETIDASGIAAGARNLEVRVYDTAGNLTTTNLIPVIKVGGADPSPQVPPLPYQAAPITFENPEVPPPTYDLVFSASLNVARKEMNMSVTGATTCTTVNILWAETAALLDSNPKVLKFFSGGQDALTFQAKKLNPLKKQRSKTIFLKADCDGTRDSAALSFKPTRLKGDRIAKTVTAWAKQLTKKLKQM